MIYTDITAYIREQAHVSSSNYSDSSLLKYANPVYHEIENVIVTEVDPDFFYSEFQTNLVSWTNEYTSQVNTATADWFKKISKVEVKWSDNDTYRSLLDDNAIQNFRYSEDYIKAQLPKSQWFWEYKRWNFFIYPTPTNNVTNGIKIYIVKSLKDLTTSSVEADIFPWQSILRQFHYLIALWTIPYVLRAKWLSRTDPSVVDARNEYQLKLKDMVKYLKNIYANPIECENPNWDFYKY